jgi:hypothetical protein
MPESGLGVRNQVGVVTVVDFIGVAVVGAKNEAFFPGRVPHVRPSVHGPKTGFSNAFTPLHEDSCSWPLSFAHPFFRTRLSRSPRRRFEPLAKPVKHVLNQSRYIQQPAKQNCFENSVRPKTRID